MKTILYMFELCFLVAVVYWTMPNRFRWFRNLLRIATTSIAATFFLVLMFGFLNIWAVVHGADDLPLFHVVDIAGVKYFHGTGVCGSNTASACSLNLNQSAATYNLAPVQGGVMWVLRVNAFIPKGGSAGAGSGTLTIGHDQTTGDANAFLTATTCSTMAAGTNLSKTNGGISAAGFGAVLEAGTNLTYTINGTCNGNNSVAYLTVGYLSLTSGTFGL